VVSVGLNLRPVSADQVSMTGRLRSDQHGFTLIELMMAAFVLVVGILGVITLIDRANASLGESNARTGATNLARELVEHTRAIDYDDVTTGRLPGPLRAKTGLTGTGSPWQVTRRGVEYTVAVEVCLFDDPVDGLVPTGFVTEADRPLCPRPAAVDPGKTDANPDDFRRLQLTITWKQRGKAQELEQDALIANPTGGLGPRITEFPDPATQFTSGTAITLNGIKSTPARTAVWTVSEGGGATGPALPVGSAGTDWSITWSLGALGTGTEVSDGAYRINVQAFSDQGVAGDMSWRMIYINRKEPDAPEDVNAGRSTAPGATGPVPVVDIRWSPNPERDVLGYVVYRVGSSAPICGSLTSPLTVTSCTDTNPPLDGAITYNVHAIDYTDLKERTGPRPGAAGTDTVPAPDTTTPPPPPADLVATTEDGLPKLRWSAPADPSTIAFYRIYRDGAVLENRYAETITNDPFWADPNPGGASHTYYVSAVSTGMSESALSPEVRWP
jgi:prepilin-type N-terminal cleavage/methylation domain-containing protein